MPDIALGIIYVKSFPKAGNIKPIAILQVIRRQNRIARVSVSKHRAFHQRVFSIGSAVFHICHMPPPAAKLNRCSSLTHQNHMGTSIVVEFYFNKPEAAFVLTGTLGSRLVVKLNLRACASSHIFCPPSLAFRIFDPHPIGTFNN